MIRLRLRVCGLDYRRRNVLVMFLVRVTPFGDVIRVLTVWRIVPLTLIFAFRMSYSFRLATSNNSSKKGHVAVGLTTC